MNPSHQLPISAPPHEADYWSDDSSQDSETASIGVSGDENYLDHIGDSQGQEMELQSDQVSPQFF